MRYPRWRIITIGHLNHNQYRDRQGIDREPLCTSTYIETEKHKIIVDPGMKDKQQFQILLDQRCNIQKDEINFIFLTHFHENHWHSLSLFPQAVWLMSKTEIRWWSAKKELNPIQQNILTAIVPIEDNLIEGIETMPTYGHTHGHTSLVFETREGIVIVAGDAILTFDHFDEREASQNCEDTSAGKRSIDEIAKRADLIIPGHDNFFVV